MFDEIIKGETRRCENCWWGTGRPAEDTLNKVFCSLLSKEVDRSSFCDAHKEKFNK